MVGSEEKPGDFTAFISYSHRDARWARWLHHKLETYRLPKNLDGIRPTRRVGRIFLDRSELATSIDLSARIQDAMDRSANLILICSPGAAASRWVNEEVRRFRAAGKADRIFCLIVDGDPASRGDDACFPPALLEPIDGRPAHEPLAADVRPHNDRPADARLKLIAGLLDVPFDALKRRDQARRQRWLVGVVVVSLALVAAMAALTLNAILAQREAVRQRDTAERTATFIRQLFEQARPEVTGGREITVRAMVDRASDVAVSSPELKREPEVRANLLATLADVYAKLRLPIPAKALLAEARRYPIGDQRTILYLATVEAGILLPGGEYPELRKVLDRAFAAMGDDPDLRNAFAAQLLLYRGQLEQATGRPDAASADYDAARRAALAADPPLTDAASTATLAAGLADIENGRLARAETRLRDVIDTRTRDGQRRDPDVLTAINSLGAIVAKRGDAAGAEPWFRRAIALQSAVYGPTSTDVALSRSNLGRALVEQRRFKEARNELEAARAEFLRQVGDKADTLANLEDSLGLALAGLSQASAAEAMFTHGLAVARANQMPKEVELLTDMAEMYCATGRANAALPLIGQARSALTSFGLTDAWRRARIDNVAGGCLLALGRRTDGSALIRNSTAAVVARWGANSLFGLAARQRQAQ